MVILTIERQLYGNPLMLCPLDGRDVPDRAACGYCRRPAFMVYYRAIFP